MTLSKTDLLMLREMGRGYNTVEYNRYLNAVRLSLEALEERGVLITKNHVRAAGTAELMP